MEENKEKVKEEVKQKTEEKVQVKDKSVEKKSYDSDNIWKEIKDLTVNIFSLPDQKISDHVINLEVPSNKHLIVKLKTPAVIVQLEEVLGDKFELDLNDKGIVQISRVEK